MRQILLSGCVRMWVSVAESGVLHMMTTIQGVAGSLQRLATKYISDPYVQMYGRGAAYFFGGFFLAAASLSHHAMPLAMGLICGCSGSAAVLAALGSVAGYLAFWGAAGQQCVLWVVLALAVALTWGRQRQQTPILLPALACLIVSASGVLFQFWLGQTAPVQVYLLRVGLAGGCAWLFYRVLRGRDPVLDWLAVMAGVLALAQLAITPWWNFGLFAGALIAVFGAFPGAALAGVALDLAGVGPVSMTATLCMGYLVRFIPGCPRWMRCISCTVAYLLVMQVGGVWMPYGLPPLLVGGLLGVFLPLGIRTPARRGELGLAQVRLEMAATALFQTEQLLLEQQLMPVDEDAILQRAAQTACAGCSHRNECKDSRRLAQLPTAVLHKPLLSTEELPIVCRKSGRFLAELHHGQEQLRSIHADRMRQEEYREAVVQQYRFMGEFLQQISDLLARKADPRQTAFDSDVQVFSNCADWENGDRCAVFMGVRDLQYVLLCDGMGTGLGAAQEGKTALQLLRRLLSAGYPGHAAIRCLNSLCALRSRAGAVTVDLLEIELEKGRARLYKWGAAPSYLIGKMGVERIGVPGPPPGLSVTEQQEQQYRFTLRRGERLVLVSDGVGDDNALHYCTTKANAPDDELAGALLRQGLAAGEDDATVVIVTLNEAE